MALYFFPSWALNCQNLLKSSMSLQIKSILFLKTVSMEPSDFVPVWPTTSLFS